MFAKVFSGSTVGLDSIPITVEVDISSKSLPSFTIVGLPSKSVEESKERVRSAIRNSGAKFPQHRITVNLAPADIPKDGPAYDLPIALGILIASDQIPPIASQKILAYGQLSLDGTLTHTNGILPIALLTKEKDYKGVFLPEVNAKEAAIVDTICVYPIPSLIALFRHLTGMTILRPHPYVPFRGIHSGNIAEFDLSDIKGQEQGKRALEIAAAGGHNLFFKGVPGAGKTMLARSLPGILPDLTEIEALEVTKIYSITGNLTEERSIMTARPFRAPHHTTSRNGLIGGGTHPVPGEVSLAHRGVLFLDEFPEFPRHVLEALRQPIEDGLVTISRVKGTITFPAKFMLVAASNPCPCGNFGDAVKKCICTSFQIINYRKRVSGPIIDRIDIHIHLPQVKMEALVGDKKSETSLSVRKRVQKARDRQTRRYRSTSFVCNSDLKSKEIKEFIPLSAECMSLLGKAISVMHLTARSYHRVIKTARTIADLSGEKDVSQSHIAEALQYRPQEEEF